MDIFDLKFRTLGLLALKTAFKIPPPMREALLFGRSRFGVPLQKVLVALLGGTFLVHTRFTEGPMSGQNFACLTSEKYFFLGSHFEDEVQRLLLDTVRPGETCYDVGGHAGYMSLLFSAIVGPTGRVFTFEPSSINFPRVRRTIEANAITNVSVLNFAASDHEGEADLEECSSMSAIVASSSDSGNPISRVRTIRLDDFAYRDGNPPPTFVKLDVEGHAGPALEGMRRIFESARPKLMCELHNTDEEGHVRRLLPSDRYRWYAIDQDGGFPRRVMILPK